MIPIEGLASGPGPSSGGPVETGSSTEASSDSAFPAVLAQELVTPATSLVPPPRIDAVLAIPTWILPVESSPNGVAVASSPVDVDGGETSTGVATELPVAPAEEPSEDETSAPDLVPSKTRRDDATMDPALQRVIALPVMPPPARIDAPAPDNHVATTVAAPTVSSADIPTNDAITTPSHSVESTPLTSTDLTNIERPKDAATAPAHAPTAPPPSMGAAPGEDSDARRAPVEDAPVAAPSAGATDATNRVAAAADGAARARSSERSPAAPRSVPGRSVASLAERADGVDDPSTSTMNGETETVAAKPVMKREPTAEATSPRARRERGGRPAPDGDVPVSTSATSTVVTPKAESTSADRPSAVVVGETAPKEIARHIHVHLSEGKSEVRLALKPEHLGELRIVLESRGDAVELKFTVQSEAAREALSSHSRELTGSLKALGWNVGGFSVDVGTSGHGRSQDGAPTRVWNGTDPLETARRVAVDPDGARGRPGGRRLDLVA